MNYNISFVDKISKLSQEGKLNYSFNTPLAQYSTFKIGGPCDFALHPTDEGALISLIRLCREHEVRYTIIGRGSNVVFADEGYDGAVIFTDCLDRLELCGNKISAGAGVPLTLISSTAQKNSLTGLEFAYGIPGSLGGAVFMNAGAYEGEMSRIVESTRYYDTDIDKLCEIGNAEHNFAYRDSIFELHPEWIILGSVLSLRPGHREKIREVMEHYMKMRSDKQPLNYPNAGSIFKRAPGYFTGKLIEDAGLKGYRIGDAQVSEKHAGFIVNLGGAKSSEVEALIKFIKERIYERNGVMLECEVRFIK